MKTNHDGWAYAALGMIAGISLSFVFVFWAAPDFYEPPQAKISQGASAQIEKSQDKEINQLIATIQQFDPWRDTYAQWLMALISIIATGASIYAVILLNETLSATRESNRNAANGTSAAKAAVAEAQETNRIAAESSRTTHRPWIKLSSTLGRRFQDGIDRNTLHNVLYVTIENVGEGPALDVFYTWETYVTNTPNKLDIIQRKTKEKLAHIACNKCAGEIIFPSCATVQNLGITIYRDQIETDCGVMKDILAPWIAISIIYRDRHRDRWYRTAMIYNIWHMHPSGGYTYINRELGEFTTFDVVAIPSGHGLID